MPLARHFLFLLHQIWDSEKSIGAIRDMPILFLSGLADEMIPPAHMKALYQIAKKVSGGRYVQFEAFDDGAHNDTCMQSGYFERIAQFIKHHF